MTERRGAGGPGGTALLPDEPVMEARGGGGAGTTPEAVGEEAEDASLGRAGGRGLLPPDGVAAEPALGLSLNEP